MLADVPAGESPASATCPVRAVVIPGGGKGDRPAGSPGVNVLVGEVENEGLLPGSVKDNGHPPPEKTWSDPPGGQASRQVVAKANQQAPKSVPRLKWMAGMLRAPSRFRGGEGRCRRSRNWAHAADELSGVSGDDMPTRSEQRKHGTTRGLPRPTQVGTAKASRITGSAGKSRRACEWGGWGRLSVDGPGQNNPDRSEGPWGRTADAVRTAVSDRAEGLDFARDTPFRPRVARSTGANQVTRSCGATREGPV